jgi:Fe2+ transport system protein A
MTLSELPPGTSGTVKKVLTDGILAQRIVDMGLYPGIVVRVIRNAPLGDPVEIEADGTFISLRRVEARFVEVVTAL